MIEKLNPVHLNDRTMGFKETFGLWIAANVVITTVLTGMLFAEQITLYQCLFAVVVGSLVGSIPLALTAKMGFRTGLPTMAVARGAFGQRGAILPAIVNVFMLIAWSWIQAYLAGVSLNYAVNYMFGYDNVNLFVIFTELVVILITINGHRLIETLEKTIANVMLVLSVVIFAVMFTHYDVHNIITMKVAENPDISTIVAFDIVIATAFSWMSSVCDYNRHCKTERSSVIGTYSGYVLASVIAMMLGFIVAAFSITSGAEGTYDPTVLLVDAGLGFYGFVAAVIVFLSVVSTNVMGLYSATYSMMSIKENLNFQVIVVILGISVALGALLKETLMASFFDFILLISTLFIPIFAIILTDFFVLKGGEYDNEDICSNEKKLYHYFHGFNLLSIAAYVSGAGFGYYFTYINPLSVGSAIPTFIISALIYLLLMRVSAKNTNKVELQNNG